jgi:hypothetical protein
VSANNGDNNNEGKALGGLVTCDSLYRSRWRAGSTIPLEIAVSRTDETSLLGAHLTLRVTNADRSIVLTKSTQAQTIAYTAQTAESLKATSKIFPAEISVFERSRFYFALEILLENGDEISLTDPGQDWFEVHPEVGLGLV